MRSGVEIGSSFKLRAVSLHRGAKKRPRRGGRDGGEELSGSDDEHEMEAQEREVGVGPVDRQGLSVESDVRARLWSLGVNRRKSGSRREG